MNSHPCCREPRAPGHRHASPARRRFRRAIEWLIPSAILLAMPKCPACIAAYLALATGLGISFSAAAQVRMLVVTLCVVALVILVAKQATVLLARLRARAR